MCAASNVYGEKSTPLSQNTGLPIMVNACTGKMGKVVIMAVEAAGLYVVPVSFGFEEESGKTFQVCGKEFLVHGPSHRERFLASVFDIYPNLIFADYTVPTAVKGVYFDSYRVHKWNGIKGPSQISFMP